MRQNAHLLGPLQPPGSLAATLATRLPADGPTKALAEQVVARLTGPYLRAITTLPDLPHPALSRVLTGHTREVTALGVAPDGSWLASASHDTTVRIWDPATGTPRHTLTGHTSRVQALVVAPDGSWLASTGDDATVRIWDTTTGALLTSLRVAGRLFHLALVSTTIAAAGEHGPYLLALCHGTESLPIGAMT